MIFAHPLFLYALAAVAIPIIIHLFNFRRYKKVYFTNVRFIRELKQETQKRSQLRHLIILLMRMLAIAALVLAFARPFLPAEADENQMIRQNAVSIFVDNSFSMQVESTEGRLLTLAKQKAGEIVDTYGNTDQFQLLTNDFRGIHQRLVSRTEMKEMLEELTISPASKGLQEIIARQKDLLKEQENLNKIIYIISDFQKNNFDLAGLKKDTLTDVYFVPLKAENVNNLFIDSCWFATPIQQVNQGVTLKVKITNSSEKDYEKIPLKLRVNGQQKALSSFNIKANSSEEVGLAYTHRMAGIKYGELEINDYPVTYDDRFYLSYRVDASIPVLSVYDEQKSPYLNSLYGRDSIFVFDQQTLRQVNYSRLSNYQLIILNNLEELPSGLVQQISRFMESGGSVVVYPSEEANLNDYNNFLSLFNAGQLNTLDTTNTELSSLSSKHLIFREVFEEIPENMDFPAVFSHYPMRILSRSATEGIMEMQNGNVFLTQTPYGKGNLYFFAAPLGEGFSQFPRHALFVPTMYQIALLSNPPQKLYYTIGENALIRLRNIEVEGEEVFHIKSRNGDFDVIPAHRKLAGEVIIDPYEQIRETGNYSITKNEKEIAGISYNYNRSESVLQYYDESEIQQLLKNYQLDNFTLLTLEKENVEKAVARMSMGRELWIYFLLAALLFLLAEVLLLRFWK